MAHRDNLAVQYDYAPTYAPARTPVRTRVVPARRTVAKPKAKKKGRLSAVLMTLAVVAVAFLALARAASITKMTNENVKREKTLTDLQAVNQQTSLEIEKSLDLKQIEETATNELGMRAPEKHQIVYVPLENPDFIEHTSSSRSFGAKVKSFFARIGAYLD